MPRLLRITTVPMSLAILLRGQLPFFQQHGFEVLAVSADGKEVEQLRKEGIEHHVVPMTRQITPLKDLISLWRMVRIIRKFKPDIVHTHTPKAGIVGQLAAWLCRVPVRMHTVAGLPLMETHGFKKNVLLMVERLTYYLATKVLPNSQGLYRYIRSNIPTTTPTIVIGKGSSNGVDIDFFRKTPALMREAQMIRAEKGLKADDFVFSFTGRIVKDKGICELTAAFQKFKDHVGNSGNRCKLLLIGPFEQQLDPLPQEVYDVLRKHPDIILAGFQSDVRPWILASDIFVFPSYREGFPNVVMQACCLEVPCIVTNINGCNEIIQENKTGLIVPPKDENALLTAMLYLAQNESMRERFGRSARAYVAAHFDQYFLWNELLAEYNASVRPG